MRIAVERWDDWRRESRRLLDADTPPDAVEFVDARSAPALPFTRSTPSTPAPSGARPRHRVPRRFLDAAELVACYRDPGRFDLLYRLLHRLTHERPDLLDDPLDDDVLRFHALHRQVRRDVHKMHAFVRFREVGGHFVAWHRPDHHVVRAAAPFFADRFPTMRWSILTPEESAHHDPATREVSFGPGAPRAAVPSADELEALWRTYYAATFNPARVNLRAMSREMPARHWATLPETRDIPDLLRAADDRVTRMIASSAMAKKVTAADYLPAPRDGRLSLPMLAQAVQRCRGCDLCEGGATQAVFGEGPPDARLVLVGEQPGDQEDLQGRPFVGPAGRVLSEAMEEVGIPRREVYVTNAVKHFKFTMRGRRRLHQTPNVTEVKSCRPWLEKEVELINPSMVIALGATAARSLFGQQFRITRSRGDVIESEWAPWAMATIHPSAILRMPDAEARAAAREAFVLDLSKAAEALKKLGR